MCLVCNYFFNSIIDDLITSNTSKFYSLKIFHYSNFIAVSLASVPINKNMRDLLEHRIINHLNL